MASDQVFSVPQSPATPSSTLAGDGYHPDRIVLLSTFSISNKSNRSNLSMSSLDCQSDFGNMDIDDNLSVNDELKATDSIIRPIGVSSTPFVYPRSVSADPMQQPGRMKRKLEERAIKDDIDLHRTPNTLVESSDDAFRANPFCTPKTPPSSPTSPVRKTSKINVNQVNDKYPSEFTSCDPLALPFITLNPQLFQTQDVDFHVPRGSMRWMKVDEEDLRLVLCLPKNFNCSTPSTATTVQDEPTVSSPRSPWNPVLRIVDADFGICLKAGVFRAYLDESLDLIDSTTTSYNNSYTVFRRDIKGEEPVSMPVYIVRMLNALPDFQYALPAGYHWISASMQLAPTLSVRIALRCSPDLAISLTAKVVRDRPVYSFFEYDAVSKKVLRDDQLRPIYHAPAMCRAVLALEDVRSKQTKLLLDCLSDPNTGAMTLSQRLQKGSLLRRNALGEVYKARHFLCSNSGDPPASLSELQSSHLCLKLARLSSSPDVEVTASVPNTPSSASSGWRLSSLATHLTHNQISENLPHDLRVMRFFQENVPTLGLLAQDDCGLVACDGHIFFSATVFRHNGSLFDRLLQQQPFTEPVIRHIVSFAAQKLLAMHRAGLCHFDVFLDNFLLDNMSNSDDLRASLTASSPLLLMDFGQSRVLTFDVLQQRFHRLSYLTQGVGKFVAFAPETCKDYFPNDRELLSWIDREGVDAEKVDVWQLGVLLYMLLAGRRPFEDPGPKTMPQPQRLFLLRDWFRLCSEPERLLTHLQQIRPQIELKNAFFSNALDLLRALLMPNPQLRLNLEQVLQHEWFIGNGDTPKTTR